MNQQPEARNGFNLKLLGAIAIVGAPAMLIEVWRNGFQKVPNEETTVLGAVLYALFSIGWLAAMLGLRQLNAAGHGKAARALMNVVVVTVTLAVFQSLMDVLKVPTHNVLYIVTDIAWPLSMVLTFAVSVAVLFARVLPPLHRLAPLYCGISLPIFLGWVIVTGQEPTQAIFAWHTATGWAALGLILILARPTVRTGTQLRPAI